MKVKEVIARLQPVNPEAEFDVIALNQSQPFTWSHGSSDGCTEGNCDTFGPYLDRLNEAERGEGQ